MKDTNSVFYNVRYQTSHNQTRSTTHKDNSFEEKQFLSL